MTQPRLGPCDDYKPDGDGGCHNCVYSHREPSPPSPPPAYSAGSEPSSDASQAGSTRPLPAHLSEPYRERRYVVFAYWTDAGWWRREGNYATLEQAQRVADAHNGQGRAVIVAQQDVTYGPHLPITGASGASPVTPSQTDRQADDPLSAPTAQTEAPDA